MGGFSSCCQSMPNFDYTMTDPPANQKPPHYPAFPFSCFDEGSAPSSSASSTPLHPSMYQTSVPEQVSQTCMWGNCNVAFDSMEALVGHVNVTHIHPSDLCLPVCDHTQVPTACLWGDCHDFGAPGAVPGPSSGDQTSQLLDIISSHLFHDHLGLSLPVSTFIGAPDSISLVGTLDDSVLVDGSNPNLYEQNAPSNNDVVDSEPSSRSTPSEVAYSQGEDSTPITTPDSSTESSNGSSFCQWQGCGMTFDSCDDLMTHLTRDHVGSGKSHYECHWKDCNRNGSENGFSSKQKILRHLQVCSLLPLMILSLDTLFQSHTGHKPFQCTVCNQSFSEAATLQQHMRRHTLESKHASLQLPFVLYTQILHNRTVSL
jgi:hypothetical protein